MIVHRFMSSAELQQLMEGKVLLNMTNQKKDRKQRSTSVGFCFFSENPGEAIHWLSGIVNLEECVTLEVPDGYLIPSKGTYADETKFSIKERLMLGQKVPMMQKQEYCRCRYSLQDGVKILNTTSEYYHQYPTREEQIMRNFLNRGYL